MKCSLGDPTDIEALLCLGVIGKFQALKFQLEVVDDITAKAGLTIVSCISKMGILPGSQHTEFWCASKEIWTIWNSKLIDFHFPKKWKTCQETSLSTSFWWEDEKIPNKSTSMRPKLSFSPLCTLFPGVQRHPGQGVDGFFPQLFGACFHRCGMIWRYVWDRFKRVHFNIHMLVCRIHTYLLSV